MKTLIGIVCISLCGCATNPYNKSVKVVHFKQFENRVIFEMDWMKELLNRIIYTGDYKCRPSAGKGE